MLEQNTIAAISTPLGTGGISVIRISGSKAISSIDKIFKSRSKKNIRLIEVSSHTIHHGFILDHQQSILDEVLISVFKKPESFTGEDTIEIHGHGGLLITQMVLERVLSLEDIRLAEPGEFTKKAFLNKKIDLAQAESIMDLIKAQNESAIKLAHSGLQKRNSRLINNLNQKILNLIGAIEVNIDYPEYEDIKVVTNQILIPQLSTLTDQIKEILNYSIQARFIKEGIKTLIIGKPNVGKSSLLNAMLDEKRAIVSDIAGTTRDFLDAYTNINGINLHLIDTAGIRETKDPLEEISISVSRNFLKKAELILLLLDQSMPLDKEDQKLLILTKNYPRILVGSKSDLPTKINIKDLKEEIILVSNITKKGIGLLKNKILKIFQLNEIQNKDFNYFSNARHIQQIKKALKALENVKKDINQKFPIDIHVINLKEAYEALGEIIGNSVKEDLVNELFSKFCLGK
ncbi:MAG: tRNA uridine-5-carboxymethylaminomethyl(34) synthesis GTPase MnmE [Weeping tea tree witches'-broom phytoplasma]|uniref:tRNA uridine-5-carboxymethylaminomethyl(34) synthesis GTPase MnmE n=1 Tax=Candidatus Phytoplasma melaleucae TaxID=2982630 RepID=UPI002939FB3B|nr:tRNA uridine-5-carboxymethylaminomethyl(34) synthesis GTPase MnmE [Weeping tea tree witches'-broom phytoplasma]